MDALGVLVLVAGIWLTYSGVTGIDALSTLQQIIANPKGASGIVRDARANVTPILEGKGGSVTSPSSGDSSTYSSWGVVRGFDAHKKDGSISPGIDFRVPVGTPVPSPVSGLLSFSGPNTGGYGNLATVTTKEGYKFHFGHVSKFVGAGNREVIPGTIIALSGGVKGAVGSGTSTGPHLHVDVQNPSGAYIDPATYLFRGRAGGGSF